MGYEISSVCLLGRDYSAYGDLSVVEVSEQSAAAISVGSDPLSPSNRFKADSKVPNEDALCVVESNEFSVYAVADAHYGPEASHTLIRRLHDLLAEELPQTVHDLSHLLDSLQDGPPPATSSETTLTVAVYNRESRSGFGISFGDSSFVISGPTGSARLVNPRNGRFVSTSPDQLPLEGAAFSFSADPGDVLVSYTDGIDECHYRSPTTSISLGHINDIAARSPGDPQAIVSELGRLALAGVNGHPGGQDNVALIASIA
jgi:serine/threonine protein phosphatase PrpC